MKQLTLVALYGPKKEDFHQFMDEIHSRIKSSLAAKAFRPYDRAQMHMTIIGLEKRPGFEENFNVNIWKKEDQNRIMHFEGLYSKLKHHFPLEVQIGGFDPRKYHFTSFGGQLHDRSFAIDTRRASVNLIGWSVNKDHTENISLLRLRNSLYQEHYIRHAYHQYEDNDFYMVLGKWENSGEVDPDEVIKIQNSIRQYLLNMNPPFRFTIEVDDLYLVQYEKQTLERASSKAWGVGELKKNPDFIEELYRDS